MEFFLFFLGGVLGCGAWQGGRRCSATSVCNALHCSLAAMLCIPIDFFGKRIVNLEIVYISGQNLLKM